MTPTDPDSAFLLKAYAAAKEAEHIWPDHAACEAALDSDWGQSELAQKANNLFGFVFQPGKTKLHAAVEGGKRVDYAAFDSWAECFAHRLHRIRTLTMIYRALRAKTAAEYVTEMAKFSVDPKRGTAITALHEQFKGLWA